ncbi:hypothetical protein GOV13_02850 [Candidatus Pacearchaeota archaeon]|nr:hypothetical protein [Candidatus Pacearchaeota archaeon]
MELKKIQKKIQKCINLLYSIDAELFKRNSGKGVCERCLVFRFAHYLQNELGENYSVDCDFNSSSYLDKKGKVIKLPGKRFPELGSDGKMKLKRRFIDIIVHRRGSDSVGSFFCFEIKKWNNYNKKGIEKDKRNLRWLVRGYKYDYAFWLVLGKTKEGSKWEIYNRQGASSKLKSIF